jgi:hypothetical protein
MEERRFSPMERRRVERRAEVLDAPMVVADALTSTEVLAALLGAADSLDCGSAADGGVVSLIVDFGVDCVYCMGIADQCRLLNLIMRQVVVVLYVLFRAIYVTP